MKKAKKKTNLIEALVAIALVGAIIGLAIGIKVSFDNGVERGREELTAEVSEDLKTLGEAVLEKSDLAQKIKTELAEVPKEINTEKIDEYISKLEKLVGEIKTDAIKPAMNEYLEKWRAFKETYAGKDNEEITEAFDTLKATAQDTASQIKNAYDEVMRAIVDKF